MRAVDGIFQVVRAFDDAEVTHVEGDVDPIRDLEIIATELRLKDTEWAEKALAQLTKTGRSLGNSSLADKARKEEIAAHEKVVKVLKEDKRDVRKGDWSAKEVEVVNSLDLLTARPVVYLVNLSEKDYVRKKNKWRVLSVPSLRSSPLTPSYRLPKIKAWVDEHTPGDIIIPFSVAYEERLSQLASDEERAEEEKKVGAPSALGKITHAGYASLEVRRPHSYLHAHLTSSRPADSVLHCRRRRGARMDDT